MLASVAELERGQISERTRAALAAAKARGVVLGNPRLRAGDAELAAKARAVRMRMARGIRTPSGGTTWHPATVLHVQRMAARSRFVDW